jgi:hypothetical protein
MQLLEAADVRLPASLVAWPGRVVPPVSARLIGAGADTRNDRARRLHSTVGVGVAQLVRA